MVDPKIMKEQILREIFGKPGRQWSHGERLYVLEWLYDAAQLRQLLSFARGILGEGANPADAEDAWGDFSVNQLYSVIESYDPTLEEGISFWRYLLFVCFKRYCKRKRILMRKKQGLTDTLEVDRASEDANVLTTLIRKGTQNKVRRCIAQLPPNYRQIMSMRYVEENSITEIAALLGKTENNVKVTLNRARAWFRRLYKKGDS